MHVYILYAYLTSIINFSVSGLQMSRLYDKKLCDCMHGSNN